VKNVRILISGLLEDRFRKYQPSDVGDDSLRRKPVAQRFTPVLSHTLDGTALETQAPLKASFD
jgi:hypothetical protein